MFLVDVLYPKQALDLSLCRLYDVELLSAGDLVHLTDLNLDHNYLSSFSWVRGLTELTSLSLKNNRIGSFWPPATSPLQRLDASSSNEPEGMTFPALEILHLGQNRISDMGALELHLFPRLIALNLASNDITQVRLK